MDSPDSEKHREDTLGILAAVNETTVEAVKKQSVLKTMRQIQEIVKDKDMLNFSNRARRRRKRNACASGSSKDKRGRADSPFADFGKAAAGRISLPYLYGGVFAHNDGNTAKFAGGSFVQAKYSDLINPKPQDNRTCEEITADIVCRRGLVVKHESI